jgi:hypothetical protein
MKNTSAFDAVDGRAYRYASAVEEEVPPWSGPWRKEQGEQAWKRRANDSLPIPPQGKERLTS